MGPVWLLPKQREKRGGAVKIEMELSTGWALLAFKIPGGCRIGWEQHRCPKPLPNAGGENGRLFKR